MKTVALATAILALAAGPALAMGGCGSYKSAAKTAALSADATHQTAEQSTPKADAAKSERVQITRKPAESQDTAE